MENYVKSLLSKSEILSKKIKEENISENEFSEALINYYEDFNKLYNVPISLKFYLESVEEAFKNNDDFYKLSIKNICDGINISQIEHSAKMQISILGINKVPVERFFSEFEVLLKRNKKVLKQQFDSKFPSIKNLVENAIKNDTNEIDYKKSSICEIYKISADEENIGFMTRKLNIAEKYWNILKKLSLDDFIEIRKNNGIFDLRSSIYFMNMDDSFYDKILDSLLKSISDESLKNFYNLINEKLNEKDKTDIVTFAQVLKYFDVEFTNKFLEVIDKKTASLVEEDLEFLGKIPLEHQINARQQVSKKVLKLISQKKLKTNLFTGDLSI